MATGNATFLFDDANEDSTISDDLAPQVYERRLHIPQSSLLRHILIFCGKIPQTTMPRAEEPGGKNIMRVFIMICIPLLMSQWMRETEWKSPLGECSI